MRGLFYVVAFIAALGVAWNKLVTHDGLLRYYDRRPNDKKGAAVLYYVGKWHEMTSDYEKMLLVYGRILERHPTSSRAMDSLFGRALALERMNRYPEAIADYEMYLEKYPNSKYAKSVRNNVEILKSR